MATRRSGGDALSERSRHAPEEKATGGEPTGR